MRPTDTLIRHSKTKVYLGDGAYVDFDGFGLVLTTEDGIRVTNRIVLEPNVYETLRRYVEQLKEVRMTTER
jgi:hypothetical protein